MKSLQFIRIPVDLCEDIPVFGDVRQVAVYVPPRFRRRRRYPLLVVHDGADYRLYKIDSVTDLSSAVTDAIGAGVDVISMSVSFYNEGWADNPAGRASSFSINGHAATFGALDIAALQNLYGANTTHACSVSSM